MLLPIGLSGSQRNRELSKLISPSAYSPAPGLVPASCCPACFLQPAKKWEAVLTEMKFGPGPTPEATADKAAVTTPTQKLDLAGALA